MTAIKNKRTQAIIIGVIIAVIVLAGAFAWSSFAQQRINTFKHLVKPGVNLHDDFEEGPNKDVYVENSGEIRVFVRVRLTEYLQTVARGSLIDTHIRDEETAKLGWFPHNGVGGTSECEIAPPYERGENWTPELDFHDYYEWKMGGQKWYMPAIYQLGTDEDGEYKALGDNPEVCSDLEEYAEGDADGKVQQTLWATVITMDTWLNGGYTYFDGTRDVQVASGERAQGNFWVVDTDGWCYWAQSLEPKTATGLLLDEVKRTKTQFGSTAEYCINVWLQAADEIDIGLFELALNGGMTENGKLLTQMVAEKIIVAEDGSFYQSNRDGSFAKITDEDGNPIADAKAFIPIGENAAEMNINEKINVPEEEKLYIGDKFDFVELDWDGEHYTNYDTLAAYSGPLYNITVNNTDGEYTVTGSEIGVDGNVYLRIEKDGKVYYLASVLRVETAGAQTFGLEENETSYTYEQGYPGTAPFGTVYQGGGKIGTGKDTYHDPETFEEKHFYHIGSGVYIEVADKESKEPANPGEVKYYFVSEMTTPRLAFNNLKNPELEAAVNTAFIAALSEGDKFEIATEKVDGKTVIKSITVTESGGFTFNGLVEDTGGKKYIDLGDGSYIAPDDEGGLAGGALAWLDDEELGLEDENIVYEKKPSGDGTQAKPFLITCREDMDWVSTKASEEGESFEGKYLKVANSFDMKTDTMGAFEPIAGFAKPFKGNFDGGKNSGYSISGLKIEKDSDYAGLFGVIGSGGTVHDLVLTDISVDGVMWVGGIAGRNYGTVENCRILAGTVDGGDWTGGIAGSNDGKITDCYNMAKVSGSNTVMGGIVGANSGEVTRCANLGDVEPTEYYFNVNSVGGIVGLNQGGKISESYARCDVTGNNSVGGIAGENGSFNHPFEGFIENCYMWGNVEGKLAVGGIAGYNHNRGDIRKVYHSPGIGADGSVGIMGNSQVGGVAGYNNGAIDYSVALADYVDGNISTNRLIGLAAEDASEECYSWEQMYCPKNSGGANTAGWETYTQTPDANWWRNCGFNDAIWDCSGTYPVLKNAAK